MDTVVVVPAAIGPESPVMLPWTLAAGERLLIEAEGDVAGFAPDSGGGIATGALVGSFAGGPSFLLGEQRLLWTAPAVGRLGLAVEGGGRAGVAGRYQVTVVPLGRRGDPRQGRFARPRIAFAARTPGDPLLRLTYEDRAGFGLDEKTLRVILDSERGERLVLTPYFVLERAGAVLAALPPAVRLPRGVNRVSATIADALGNVSPEARVFLDQP